MVCILLMSRNDTTEPAPSAPSTEPARDTAPVPSARKRARATKPWQVRVHELLTRAAKISASHGVEVDPFLRGAWSAYVDVRPGLRAYLEDMQLKAQLEQLRESGRIGTA